MTYNRKKKRVIRDSEVHPTWQKLSSSKENVIQIDQQAIAKIFVDYNQSLLGNKESHRTTSCTSILRNGNVLSTAQQLELLKPYKAKEIKAVMFSIGSTKSPGPDGYGSFFFKAAWEIIGEDITKGYGFPEPFTELVMRCVTSTKFTIKVNGEGHGYFQDDLMVLCKGNMNSIKRIIEALKHFSEVTGLVANVGKSSIFLAGMEDSTKQLILKGIVFVLGSLPIRYLGLPLSSKKWSKVECHQLVEKITCRIKSGYVRKLSYAGRVQIINAVIFSIYDFWGAVFILPQSVLDDIDK
ncbi:hypothetical protein MTR67_051728 [Solanum verrucosum]|uniref:Reverse transcriptase domain-containing protein n=1 Tax=Solanum verrucosum TaxID=315347 RepID=A0AAF0V3V3_SOLVR|nr:hypothetical protein MTR67_051728 [Solanum verrucosum]